MINLYDAKLTDGLPRVLANEAWVQALAYAVQQMSRRLLALCTRCGVYAKLTEAADDVLDALAVEMRTPNYSQALPRTVKIELIISTLSYWQRLGTNSAVADSLKSIFGEAEISDWYEYNGNEGYFRITTMNPSITGEKLVAFQNAVANVKRLSAWLDGVLILSEMPHSTIHSACVMLDEGTDILKEVAK